MKTILSLMLVLASLAVANAQTYAPQVLGNMPATLATTVETNLATTPVIDVRKQNNVAITFSFNQTSASTSNVVYVLHRSIDGSRYDTNREITVTIPSTGAATNNYTTNISCSGIGYIRLAAIRNTTSITTMTNFGVTYAIKTGL